MILDDFTSFWWENLTGPRMLIEKIGAHLSDGKNVILRTEGRLPWQEQMRDFVSHRLAEASFPVLEGFEAPSREELVPSLLNLLHLDRDARCPAGYDKQLKYLRGEESLAGKVVWLVPRGEATRQILPQFLYEYRSEGLARHGLFVAELPKTQTLPSRLLRQAAVVDCAEFIRPGDLMLFAGILTDGDDRIPQGLKSCLAGVSASLVGQNAELIPDLLREMDYGQKDPIDALGRVLEQWDLPFPGREALEPLLWRAQLNAAFAPIEMERLRITEQYADLIEEALGVEFWNVRKDKPDLIRQRGDELESAADVELGTLVRMMALRRYEDRTTPLLSFPDEGLRPWIIFLRDCRNNLAHHRVCTPEQMYRLLCLGQ